MCTWRGEHSRTRMSGKLWVEGEVWVATWVMGEMLRAGGWGRKMRQREHVG